MKKTLLTLLIGTGLMLSAPAYAHEGEDHHMEGMKGTETPAASPHNAFTTLDKGYADLQSAIAAGSFDTIHETVEGMEPALASLKAAHEDDAGITGTVDMIVKALSDLHTAGDAKDTAKMEEQLKKLDCGLRLLKARLPDEHSKKTESASFSATA